MGPGTHLILLNDNNFWRLELLNAAGYGETLRKSVSYHTDILLFVYSG